MYAIGVNTIRAEFGERVAIYWLMFILMLTVYSSTISHSYVVGIVSMLQYVHTI